MRYIKSTFKRLQPLLDQVAAMQPLVPKAVQKNVFRLLYLISSSRWEGRELEFFAKNSLGHNIL